ncbi:MAG: hypothetical protein GQ468_02870 [Candidatus Scalindua sp.]|nr:hypothetical protein [Candidatus Scalindua sp.]
MRIKFTTQTETSNEIILAEGDIQTEADFVRINHRANGAYVQYFRVDPKRPFHLSIDGTIIDDYTTAKLFLAAEGDSVLSDTDIISRVLANNL